jgi:hypothetical protein
MPASRRIHRDPVGPNARRHRAGPAEAHPPDLRHPDLAYLARQTTHVPLLPAPPHDAESLISAGLTPRRPPGRVLGVEEGGHRLGEVSQCPLLHHLGASRQPRIVRPRLCELSALLQVARGALPAWMPVRVLLDSQIPYVPGMGTVIPQHRLLGGRGLQPVPGHANTVTNTTDISGEVKQRPLLGSKAGNFTLRSQ